MQRNKKTISPRIITYAIFTLGAVIEVLSIIYVSSFLAILGLSIFFWGAITLFIKPFKHVPLALLNASAISSVNNIERILNETNTTEKGLYLPPKYLTNLESSLVFVPKKQHKKKKRRYQRTFHQMFTSGVN